VYGRGRLDVRPAAVWYFPRRCFSRSSSALRSSALGCSPTLRQRAHAEKQVNLGSTTGDSAEAVRVLQVPRVRDQQCRGGRSTGGAGRGGRRWRVNRALSGVFLHPPSADRLLPIACSRGNRTELLCFRDSRNGSATRYRRVRPAGWPNYEAAQQVGGPRRSTALGIFRDMRAVSARQGVRGMLAKQWRRLELQV
jgi:hypothetical protein